MKKETKEKVKDYSKKGLFALLIAILGDETEIAESAIMPFFSTFIDLIFNLF